MNVGLLGEYPVVYRRADGRPGLFAPRALPEREAKLNVEVDGQHEILWRAGAVTTAEQTERVWGRRERRRS